MNAIVCLIEGFSWLRKPGLKKYILVPLFINIVIFSAAIYGFFYYFDALMGHFLPAESWLNYLRWILWPLLVILLAVMVFYTFTLLANLIAAPFNGFLAEAVETLESGQKPNNQMSLHAEIWLSIKQELYKTAFFVIRAIPLVIIMFIPGINAIAPILWFLYAAWSAYLQYMDYPMANHGIVFNAQRHILKSNPLATFGFGGLSTAMMTIPLLNLIAMPVSVIGATLYWSRHIRPNLSRQSMGRRTQSD